MTPDWDFDLTAAPQFKRVLVWFGDPVDGFPIVGFRNRGLFFDHHGTALMNLKAWMPAPEPPHD